MAADRNVTASTQNQALSALLFLFTQIFGSEIELNAQRPVRLPVVLPIEEVRNVLCAIPRGPYRILAGLMYGAGLRLMETCRICVKDVDFGRRQIMVRDGKGEKDRMVPLPAKLAPHLRTQLQFVQTSLPQTQARWGGRWRPGRDTFGSVVPGPTTLTDIPEDLADVTFGASPVGGAKLGLGVCRYLHDKEGSCPDRPRDGDIGTRMDALGRLAPGSTGSGHPPA